MESGRKSPESVDFSSGNVLPPDFDAEKENPAVDIVVKQKIDDEKKETKLLINNFEKEKSVREKLNILQNFSRMELNDEILSLVEKFSEDLIAQNKKIRDEDAEFADDFEAMTDYDDTVMRPLVFCLVEILKKTKETKFQQKGEIILMNLLKNWDDFEADYFYGYRSEFNDWQDKEQVKEALAQSEFVSMHKEFGFDEKIDDFSEDVKTEMTINIAFVTVKNKAIRSLGEIGTKESIDFLLEEFVKGGRSVHNRELAKAFDNIDPNYAKQKLIELAKNSDETVKVNAIMILYRLQFGESIESGDSATNLACRKFHEIIEQNNLSREELETLFKNEKNISDEEIEKISQNLINKAGQVLIKYSSEMGKGGEADREKLINDLDTIEKDSVLVASVYKAMDKNETKFEDFEGVTFEQKTADQILENEADLAQMLEIYSKNYEHRPIFRDRLLESFKEKIENQGEKTTLYIYKKDGKIVAFNRFDDLGGGKKYFGSFNVDPIVQDSSVGNGLFRASIEKESANSDIEATCDVFSPSSIMYIEKGGFAVKEVMPEFDEETKEPAFRISKEKNKIYSYQKKRTEEIISEYESDFSGNKYEVGRNSIILKFAASEPGKLKSQEMLNEAEKLVNKEKYALTRYFCSKDKKDIYCVFEK